jgi:rubredoxin
MDKAKARLGEQRAEFSPTVKEWALIRARYRCEECKGKKPNLQFHHIGNRMDRSTFNCKVLCPECHRKVHVNETKVMICR